LEFIPGSKPVYKFSDKLAQTIDATDISAVTLMRQADRSVTNNAVVIYGGRRKILEVIASIGNSFFDPWKINDELTLLSNMILRGQSEFLMIRLHSLRQVLFTTYPVQ